MKKIEIKNLSKSYRKVIVLNNINYIFKEGFCYLITGANGTGKSTFLNLIIGLIYPNHGYVNNNLLINYVPDKNILPFNVTINKILLLLTELKNDNYINTIMLMKYFDIYNNRYKKINELSKGMIQKVLIIQAFIGNPDVIIFDEALNGLDKDNQEKLKEIIEILKRSAKTIIITSHYPDYYNDLCDCLIYLKRRVLAMWRKIV